jgi:hypothetical protein
MSKTLEELIGDEDIPELDDLEIKFEMSRTLEEILRGQDISSQKKYHDPNLNDDGDNRLIEVLRGSWRFGCNENDQ